MMRTLLALTAALLLCSASLAQTELPPNGEVLTYNVNWPSGLSLGEAQMRADRVPGSGGAPGRWDLRLSLDAAIPGFSVSDRYRSAASTELCSQEFEKEITRGKKTAKERVTFDAAAGSARRETLAGGGISVFRVPSCAKDALAFVYFLRRELSQGRLPAAQTIIFGGEYQLRLEYGGRQRITIGDQQLDADRVTAAVKGKASDTSVEIFIAQDRSRRPLLIRVPLALGAFSMELVP
jgi:hypothetical protein